MQGKIKNLLSLSIELINLSAWKNFFLQVALAKEKNSSLEIITGTYL